MKKTIAITIDIKVYDKIKERGENISGFLNNLALKYLNENKTIAEQKIDEVEKQKQDEIEAIEKAKQAQIEEIKRIEREKREAEEKKQEQERKDIWKVHFKERMNREMTEEELKEFSSKYYKKMGLLDWINLIKEKEGAEVTILKTEEEFKNAIGA